MDNIRLRERTLPLAEYRRLLGTYLRPQRGHVALIAILLLGGIALQLINPQIVRYFIDATQNELAAELATPRRDDLTPWVYVGLTFIGISLMGRLLTVATTYLSIDVGWRATNALRADLTGHLLRLDMPFHKTHTPGMLIERVDGDVNELADFFSQLVIRAITSGLLILSVLVLLFIENWLAGLAL